MSGPPVTVEVIVLRVTEDGWAYRPESKLLKDGDSPCDVAREVAEGPAILHSTSWRHELGRGVILTYAAYPDRRPGAGARGLDEAAVAFGESADTPRPAVLALGNVTAHAIRHLAFLARTDPAVSAAVAADPPLAARLAGAPAEPAAQF
ncbi:hypothetical protein ACIBG7_02070 [Nonomuraea sp. NPDC050328]|uniref:hypothetical protein n=1 Tax=Nonomuraea sp. NPDC050328 TaxID=3364361 RepID=UPI003796775B